MTLSLIGLDDLAGQCGQGPYPLLRAVANVFGLTEQSRMEPETPKNLSISSPETRILCSISAKADTYRNPIRFTLESINARLCTHLLIDYQSTLLTPSSVQQLKSNNTGLKILLTIPNSDNINVDQLVQLLQGQNADGINLYITGERSSRDITELLQVNASSICDEVEPRLTLSLSTEHSKDVVEEISVSSLCSSTNGSSRSSIIFPNGRSPQV